MREALYWEALPDRQVICRLCPHNCRIPADASGLCRVRVNKDGVLLATNYARVSSVALDPVEKKPLYHFYPGKSVLSLGSIGCNFHCLYCQNYGISQEPAQTSLLAPAAAVELAGRQGPTCIGLAYTYNEPLVGYEYVYDTAQLARKQGLRNVLVTNGFVESAPFDELLPLIQALNIDLKAYDDNFYRQLCAGSLAPVLRSIEAAVRAGCHVELTNLIIPGYNDAPEQIDALAAYIADISVDLPLHLTRYFPSYKLDVPATPVATLQRAAAICRKRLRHVHIGNV